VAFVELQNSTYLDLTSYRGNAPLPGSTGPNPSFAFNVALVFERANDPATLLEADWGARQAQLEALNANNTLWSTYGADAAAYQQARTELTNMGLSLFPEGTATQYVSSAESRTIWVKVDQSNFATLFGTDLLTGVVNLANTPVSFWQGNLSLPDTLTSLGVKGLMFDTTLFLSILADPGTGTAAELPQGPLSPGNSGPSGNQLFPNEIAALYDFPFNSATTPDLWQTVQAATIGLVEPNLGTNLGGDPTLFATRADEYRTKAGVTTKGTYVDVSPGGTPQDSSNERTLDVGVATTASPTSTLVLYAGSGDAFNASGIPFTAYQAAFWDEVNKPAVVSSSFRDYPHIAPGSPFDFAYRELFVDAALRNITMVNAVGDGGSGDQYANGLTNVDTMHASPYTLVTGGTSLSSLPIAAEDPTLVVAALLAMQGNLPTLWNLVASGLTSPPSAANPEATQRLIEAVWNDNYLVGNRIIDQGGDRGGFLNNSLGAGGVDPSQPQPSYQTDFGLRLTTPDPLALTGRGVPDVSGASGGNLNYKVPQADMGGLRGGSGTSAVAPLWSALTAQFDAIFADQGLPNLGYMNDLLYMAATIAPASFNDVTVGNNTSSFVLGGSFVTPPVGNGPATVHVTPTGYGYEAETGYDLTTGLGTPNGLLLARALTAIAHEQTSFGNVPHIVDIGGGGGLSTAVAGTLLVQAHSPDAMTVDVTVGAGGTSFASGPSAAYAWTSLLAQQSLQSDFDPNLVRMFDKQAQGGLGQAETQAGDSLAVAIDGAAMTTPQVKMSSAFGFVDFAAGSGGGSDGGVRVARPVAVAETAGGADDQQAVVRVRQNGQDSLSLTFYKVDDFNGAIGGLHPGDAGYAAAALARAYQFSGGATSLTGPGYGNYAQAMLQNVDAGDLVAMTLTNQSSGNTYWAFSQANETVGGRPVGHLWNYGLNTWGWEDTRGGGDHDFNDLVVQLDFTSASGSGWLV
jgi:hypothetical protein